MIASPFNSLDPDPRPILVFVPGIDGTALMLYRQMPILSRQFQVIPFPLPNDARCTMQSLVNDLRLLIEDVLKHSPHSRVLLCGESFGGALSLSFSLAHPQLLHGLVIINSFPFIRQRLQLFMAPKLLKAVPWQAMPTLRRWTESRLHSPHATPHDLSEFHRRMLFVGKKGYIRRLQILRTFDVRDRLQEIQTPTLFLAGDQDRLILSVQEARFMASRMPHAQVTVLKGYGHICLINRGFNLLEHIRPTFNGLSFPEN